MSFTIAHGRSPFKKNIFNLTARDALAKAVELIDQRRPDVKIYGARGGEIVLSTLKRVTKEAPEPMPRS
ncbi:MAG: hypothetical protein HYR63_07190 [Proteobacteria bacterium]|nr:hypothetical protein [Pseudomonadota bacterium]